MTVQEEVEKGEGGKGLGVGAKITWPVYYQRAPLQLNFDLSAGWKSCGIPGVKLDKETADSEACDRSLSEHGGGKNGHVTRSAIAELLPSIHTHTLSLFPYPLPLVRMHAHTDTFFNTRTNIFSPITSNMQDTHARTHKHAGAHTHACAHEYTDITLIHIKARTHTITQYTNNHRHIKVAFLE